MKDPNYVAKLEKALKAKFGEDTLVSPKETWSEEKEKEYLEQVKEQTEINKVIKKEEETVHSTGYIVSEKLITKSIRTCSFCGIYSLNEKDELYLTKYECCYRCFLEHEWEIKNNDYKRRTDTNN